MKELQEYVVQNPQIGAAIITALCGIIGIFINIFINIRFRNRDYKDKNRIQKIENHESYYLPLLDKVEQLENSITVIIEAVGIDADKIFQGQMKAEYAYNVKIFKDTLSDLRDFLNNETHKYQDDYKLFKCYQAVKKSVEKFYSIANDEIDRIKENSLTEFRNELAQLSYMIQYSGAIIMIDKLFPRIRECYKIRKKYHTKKSQL